MRHRLKRIFNAMRGSAEIPSPAGTQTEVAENQP
jgi:hypothetical protein